MNKKIIIILTVILSLGGTSSIIAIYYHSKNQDSLEVEEEAEESESEEKEAKKDKKEEIIDIPWTCTWKGEVCSLPICIIASLVIGFVISRGCVKKAVVPPVKTEPEPEPVERVTIPAPKGFRLIKELYVDKKPVNPTKNVNFSRLLMLFYSSFFLLIFTLLSPFALAFKKFGKRSYFQRLPKTYSKCKIITDSITSVIALIVIISVSFIGKSVIKEIYGNDAGCLKHFFCCCKSSTHTIKELLEKELEKEKNKREKIDSSTPKVGIDGTTENSNTPKITTTPIITPITDASKPEEK